MATASSAMPSTAQTSFTYTQAKLYNVQLKVTDNQGAFDVAQRIDLRPGTPAHGVY